MVLRRGKKLLFYGFAGTGVGERRTLPPFLQDKEGNKKEGVVTENNRPVDASMRGMAV